MSTFSDILASAGNLDVAVEQGKLGTAVFSTPMYWGDRPAHTHRYLLTRLIAPNSAAHALSAQVRDGGDVVAFVMLNPSTATADKDDPTIAKCRRYAARWGFEYLIIANAYAWRDKDPKALRRAEKRGEDVVGKHNDAIISAVAQHAHVVVCAWGANCTHDRAARVHGLIPAAKRHALRITTKSRMPEHPLYLPGDLEPAPWEFGR